MATVVGLVRHEDEYACSLRAMPQRGTSLCSLRGGVVGFGVVRCSVRHRAGPKHLLAEVFCDHYETVERADRSSQAWLLAPTNLGSMWSTSSVPRKAIRVFGALLALEVVTGRSELHVG